MESICAACRREITDVSAETIGEHIMDSCPSCGRAVSAIEFDGYPYVARQVFGALAPEV